MIRIIHKEYLTPLYCNTCLKEKSGKFYVFTSEPEVNACEKCCTSYDKALSYRDMLERIDSAKTKNKVK